MMREMPRRVVDGGGVELSALPTERVARWLLGLRLVAVSALLVGALVVQSATEEILPIVPLARVAGLTYALSLVWVLLWVLRIPPRLHAALQISGDLVILATLVYLTGGPASPFAFLFLISVAVGALMFGLRGALTVAGGAFVLYAAMAEALAFGVIRPARFGALASPLGASALPFQIFVTGAGFAVVALLTSYLAHSLQRAESRLRGERESSARLFAISADVLRSVDSGVLAADVDGRVVLANPAAHRILRDEREFEGKHLAALLPLEGVEWPRVLRRLASGSPVRLEGTVVGGSVVVGCTVTALTDAAATQVGLVVHFRDLTEVRETAKRERLRERMEAVGEMAAGIAHEIRNPLASISGSAQVLGKVPALGPNEHKLSRIIVEESRRLSGIIESFLGFARPPDPQRGPCDIARTLDETLTLFANSSELTDRHRVATDVKPHGHPILADAQQLRQAFYNLARNAIQAMPSGGTMRVEAGPEGGDYVIRWRDEGVGMGPQQIQEIFQPFKAFRKGGTGLGLAVVYSIVSDHHGDIGVESAPGSGTTFTLRFPLETE
jgi:two-component system sensor histidine kinase PilS (NtrC family)